MHLRHHVTTAGAVFKKKGCTCNKACFGQPTKLITFALVLEPMSNLDKDNQTVDNIYSTCPKSAVRNDWYQQE